METDLVHFANKFIAICKSYQTSFSFHFLCPNSGKIAFTSKKFMNVQLISWLENFVYVTFDTLLLLSDLSNLISYFQSLSVSLAILFSKCALASEEYIIYVLLTLCQMASYASRGGPSNGSVYVCKLPAGTDENMLAEYFGTIGLLKVWGLTRYRFKTISEVLQIS